MKPMGPGKQGRDCQRYKFSLQDEQVRGSKANKLYCMLEICKKRDAKYSHSVKRKVTMCWMDVLINLIVVIISQYICLSSHHILDFIQFLLISYVSET